MIQPTDLMALHLHDDVFVPGVVEDIRVHDDATFYFVRCIHTGVLYCREAGDLRELSAVEAERARNAMELLEPAVPQLKVVHRSADGSFITQGCVVAEMRRTTRAPRPAAASTSMWLLGLNASTNQFA